MKEIETEPDPNGACFLLHRVNRPMSKREDGAIHPASVMLEEIRTARSSQI
jgi:hypothetical protein